MTSSPGQHHFDILDSEVLLDAPIIAVRRDTLRMPGGGTGKREIVEHFGAVAVVAFDGANIALVHQYRHSVQRRLWETAGWYFGYCRRGSARMRSAGTY